MNLLASRTLKSLCSFNKRVKSPFVSGEIGLLALCAILLTTCTPPDPAAKFKVQSYSVGTVKVEKKSGSIPDVETSSTMPEVKITFSDEVLPSSVSASDFKLKSTSGGSVALSSRLSSSNKVITVKPLVDLSPGTTYQFTASSKVKNKSGTTIESSDVYQFNIKITSSTKATPPGAPQVSLAAGELPATQITVTLGEPSDTGKGSDGITKASIRSYTVEYAVNENFTDSKTVTINDDNTAVIKELTPETKYYVRAKATNSAQLTGNNSDTQTITTAAKTGAAAPAVHEAPTVNGTPAANLVTLNIPAFSDFGKDAQDNALTTGTRTLQYRVDIDGEWTDSEVELPSPESEGIVAVSSLNPSTVYYFRVAVSNSNAEGEPNTTEGSVSESVTTAAAGSKTEAPAIHGAPTVNGTPTSTTIMLDIPALSDFGKDMEGNALTTGTRTLQMRIGTDGEWTDSEIDLPSPESAGTVTVSNLNLGAEYYFRVVASNSNADGEPRTTEGQPSEGIMTPSAAAAPAVHEAPTVSGAPTNTSITVNVPAFSDFGKDPQGNVLTTGTRTLHMRMGADAVWTDSGVELPSPESTETVTVSNLTPSTEYYFRVVVSNANTDSDYNNTEGQPSEAIMTLTAAAAPAVHEAPTVSGTPTSTSITVNVSDFSDFGKDPQGNALTTGIRALQVRMGMEGAWTNSGVELPSPESAGTVTVSNLDPNTAYYFHVAVSNSNTDSEANTTLGTTSESITTASIASAATAPVVHPAPTVNGEPTGNAITLNIPAFSDFGKDPQGNALTAGTRVLQMRQGISGIWSNTNVELPSAATVGTVAVSNLTPGTVYSFRVVATNSNTGEDPSTKEGQASADISTMSGATSPTVHEAPTVNGSPTSTYISMNIPAFSNFGKDQQGNALTIGTRTLQVRVGANGVWNDAGVQLLSAATAVNATANNLSPDTEYYFRVVVSNTNTSDNTTAGRASVAIRTTSAAAAPALHPAPTANGEPTDNAITLNIPAFSGFGKDQQGNALTIGTRTLQIRMGVDGAWNDAIRVQLPDAATAGTVAVGGLSANTAYYFRINVSNSNTNNSTTEGEESNAINTMSMAEAPAVHEAPTLSGSPASTYISVDIPAFSGFGKDPQGNALTTGTRTLQVRMGANGAWNDADVATAATVTVNGLSPDTEYYFRVVVSNTNTSDYITAGQASVAIRTASVVAAPALHPAPTVNGEPTGNAITLNIPAFSGFGKDQQGNALTIGTRTLQVRMDADGAWNDAAGVQLPDAATAGTVTASGLTPNTIYYFRIAVSNSNTSDNTTEGEESNVMRTASAAEAADVHPAPTVNGVPTSSAITLNIPAFSGFGKDQQGNALTTGTRVLQMRTRDSVEWINTGVGLPGATTAGTITVSDLTSDTEYYFRVGASNNAINSSTNGQQSEAIRTASTAEAPVVHEAPTLRGTPGGYYISLTIPIFFDYGKGPQGQFLTTGTRVLQIRTGDSGEWTDTDLNLRDGTEERPVSQQGLTDYTTYYFRVVVSNTNATNNTTEGKVSAAISTTTSAVKPGRPQIGSSTGQPYADNKVDVSANIYMSQSTSLGKDKDGTDATIVYYTLQYSLDESFKEGVTEKRVDLPTPDSKNDITYTITLLDITEPVTYYFRAKAVNSAELEGDFSDVSRLENVGRRDARSAPGEPVLTVESLKNEGLPYGFRLTLTPPDSLGTNTNGDPWKLTYTIQALPSPLNPPGGLVYNFDSAASATGEPLVVKIDSLTSNRKWFFSASINYQDSLISSSTNNSGGTQTYELPSLAEGPGVHSAPIASNVTSTSITLSIPAFSDFGKSPEGVAYNGGIRRLDIYEGGLWSVLQPDVDGESATKIVEVTDLTPNTQYRFRVIVENANGGPVEGVDSPLVTTSSN